MAERYCFGNNEGEDVEWLFSLSESELDMLISLKKLVIQRAKVIGHGGLAQKFDLKMLRALGYILMEYLKGEIEDSGVVPDLVSSAFLDGCNLLKCKLGGVGPLNTEDSRAPKKKKKKRMVEA